MKSQSETRIGKELNMYRKEVMTHLKYIVEKVDSHENHLKKLNDRTRKNEVSISWIKGVGASITFILGSILTWLNIDN